jgi:hypothetical protein
VALRLSGSSPTNGRVSCPFCRTMIGDGLTQKQSEGQGEDVRVQDVAQLLLAAVKRGDPVRQEQADTAVPAPAPTAGD